MRLLYTIIFVLVAIGTLSYGGEVPKKVVIFWVPPEVETYVPVTVKNIEQWAFKIVSVRDERQADQVLSLIQSSNQGLDSDRIRIKISTEHKFYNFDLNGIGMSSKHEPVKIDIQKLKQVLCE